jgi:hypothetical protein
MSKFKSVHPLDWTLVAGDKTNEPLFVIKSEGAIARTAQGWLSRGFELMSEADAENRMNVIGQNGNVGYPEEKKCGYFIEGYPEACSKDNCVCHNPEEEKSYEEVCGDMDCNCLQAVQERPDRYSSREVNGMDVIDLVKHWGLNFNEGNILKYLLRNKGEDIKDLEKIIDYAQRELKHKLKK